MFRTLFEWCIIEYGAECEFWSAMIMVSGEGMQSEQGLVVWRKDPWGRMGVEGGNRMFYKEIAELKECKCGMCVDTLTAVHHL